MTDTVLILDLGSQLTQLIARRVREAGDADGFLVAIPDADMLASGGDDE